jgi:hypothetical protein
MHNLPTNNETNIIRNIFTQSSKLINEGAGRDRDKEGRGKGKLKTDRAARDAQREADRAAAEEKAATPTNIFPAADLGNLGPQTRTVSTADRLQLPNGKYVDLQRDDQGRVVGQQDVPPEPKPKKERTQAQIDAALEGGQKAAETRAQRDPTEAEWLDRNKRKLPPLIGPTGKNILKYTGASIGAAMLGGSIAGPLFTNNWDDKGEGEDRRYSTIEDRPVTPKPAPAPAPAPQTKPAPTPAAPEVKPTQTAPATKPAAPTNFVEITPEEQAKIDAQKPNKNLGGLAASYGLGTTDDVRRRSQTVVDQLASTFNNIVNAPSKPAAPAKLPEQPMDRAVAEFRNKPAAPAKLPEQPMDRAVRQFRNREEEEKIARSTLSEPTTPSITPVTPKPSPMYPPEGQTRPSVPQPTTKGAYESGQQVSEAEWKARADKAQAAYNNTRAKKAGYRDYAHYQQMQDESQSLQTTISAQQSRLAELDKSNDAKIAALKAQAAATKKAGDEIDPVGAAMRRNINRAAGRPEDEDLPADMQARITNRTESGGVTSEPITDFSPEAQRRRTAARDQARFGTYQGVPKRDTGYGTMKPISEVYYRRLANLFEETRDSLEDVSAKRRERQVTVAGLEGQVNPHGFKDLVKGIRNVQAFSGMGGGGMPKERVEKQSENIGERTVAKADQRKALMAIMSASQDHADLKDRFTKEDALNPHSPLHKMLVSRNPDLRDESKVMAKYYTGS